MAPMIDGVLLLGFGGPTPGCCERRATCSRAAGCESECFVSGILGDNPARSARVQEITAHYRELGGYSPYNELTYSQRDAVSTELRRRGVEVAIACGFRHWRPWTLDGLTQLAAAGCREVLLVVLAPHQSSVSWDWYLKHAAEAHERLGPSAPRLVGAAEPWWNAPGFVRANAQRIRAATSGWTRERFDRAALILSAHAVPDPVAQTSRYCQQVAETAALVAHELQHETHTVCYQSAPSEGRLPWTGPDVLAAIRSAVAGGARDVVLQAVGFLVDHTEVLYDLDIEAKALTASLGATYTRAACVHDHPDFIGLIADRIERAVRPAVATA
jgi:protoporphyrin/coproporphyrin ferrochelatase